MPIASIPSRVRAPSYPVRRDRTDPLTLAGKGMEAAGEIIEDVDRERLKTKALFQDMVRKRVDAIEKRERLAKAAELDQKRYELSERRYQRVGERNKELDERRKREREEDQRRKDEIRAEKEDFRKSQKAAMDEALGRLNLLPEGKRTDELMTKYLNEAGYEFKSRPRFGLSPSKRRSSIRKTDEEAAILNKLKKAEDLAIAAIDGSEEKDMYEAMAEGYRSRLRRLMPEVPEVSEYADIDPEGFLPGQNAPRAILREGAFNPDEEAGLRARAGLPPMPSSATGGAPKSTGKDAPRPYVKTFSRVNPGFESDRDVREALKFLESGSGSPEEKRNVEGMLFGVGAIE